MVLAVITTLALLVAGVEDQSLPVRGVASVTAAGAGGVSIVLARSRGNLVGWYLIAVGVVIIRVLAGA
ncbi:hypothetical protein [Curtobacterium sp. MCSS17_015]|uniref:hypothetical protein n=1 Tax=Curtobacterium sp. MCSS17_015 TaxID=2175666 RepID=UPI000DA823F1|nr:hypothetical protein [Curtobacterium sp. MCSS17_015]WIB26257.1 hypothetical protein DEJ18_14595 [Curtobacterium sp. MCSS17_015]